eukprot:2939972-Pleurochrysis_carterae.AAC.1
MVMIIYLTPPKVPLSETRWSKPLRRLGGRRSPKRGAGDMSWAGAKPGTQLWDMLLRLSRLFYE